MILSFMEEYELFPAFPEDLGPLDARGHFWLSEICRILDTWTIEMFEPEEGEQSCQQK